MIIGIDGFPGAGKDTVADILVKEGFTKVSFADYLREAVVYATGLSLDTFLDRDLKDKAFDTSYIINTSTLTRFCFFTNFVEKTQEVVDKYSGTEAQSPREILQLLATEVGRNMLDESIWLNAYKRSIVGLAHVVTPDSRFSNERELIKELDGLVFYVDRDGISNQFVHKSENDKWPIDKYDVVVHNDKGFFELKRGIRMWWVLNGSKR